MYQSSLTTSGEPGSYFDFNYEVNKKHHIMISQLEDPISLEVIFTIEVDGGVEHTKINTTPTIFSVVNLFLGVWHVGNNFDSLGILTNLCITNLHHF